MSIYNLNCTGNETSLWDCQFTTSYNGRYCGQSNDASVFCMRKLTLENQSLTLRLFLLLLLLCFFIHLL